MTVELDRSSKLAAEFQEVSRDRRIRKTYAALYFILLSSKKKIVRPLKKKITPASKGKMEYAVAVEGSQ